MTKDEKRRLDALVEGLTIRLRPVCANWPEPMFQEMVRQLAEITVKYEGHDGLAEYDRRGTDRLVSDMRNLLERSQNQRDSGETSLE
jgi:hypothetical protein